MCIIKIFLLPADVLSLFSQRMFSDHGSLDYSKEQSMYLFFKERLQELEGMSIIFTTKAHML